MTGLMQALVNYEGKEIRRVWHEGQWYFAVQDVVLLLSGTVDVKQYVKRIRLRDSELNSKWGTICTPLAITSKDGKKRKENCASAEGVLRIIQSIPSPKAEPFRQWLARVGKERIDEIRDPELALQRMKDIYEQKGYDRAWIDKRQRGIAVRNSVTKEWENRGAHAGRDFAILTNEIYVGAFDHTAKELKEMKEVGLGENLRDQMGDIELLITALGEATATKLSQGKDSHGLPELRSDAREGGEVAGSTRKDIEGRLGTSIITTQKQLLPKDDE